MFEFLENFFDRYIEEYQKSDIALWFRNYIVRKMDPRHWKWFILFYIIFTGMMITQVAYPLIFQVLHPEIHAVSWLTYDYNQNFDACHRLGSSIASCADAYMTPINRTSDSFNLPVGVGFQDLDLSSWLAELSVNINDFTVGDLRSAAENYFWCVSDIVCEKQERLLMLYANLRAFAGLSSSTALNIFSRLGSNGELLQYLAQR